MSKNLQFTRDDIVNARYEAGFKPIIDLRTLEIVGVEAIGYIHTNQTMVPTYVFQSYSNQLDLAWHVDMKTLEAAAVSFNDIRMHNRDAYDLKLHINLSMSYLDQESLVHEGINTTLVQVAAQGKGFLAPRDIVLEINNDTLVTQTDKFFETAGVLKQFGYDIILDDYVGNGTGLPYLRDNLFLDGFKLNKGFILGLADDKKRLSQLNDLTKVVKSEGIRIIADGIDTRYERRLLDNCAQIPYGQGNYPQLGGEMTARELAFKLEMQSTLKKIARDAQNSNGAAPPFNLS